ncbi:pirin domain-protein domain-containing protein-containing protein [Auricularia subglabra TFB-10046 SS5]|nr:pirin domain-protein domain-containing protein-containing protein [Auricularia subglabra TFB-10046 SS5]
MASPNVHIEPFRSEQRNNEELSWLNAYQTWLPHKQPLLPAKLRAYGSLQILNEDRIAVGGGFPLHPHRDFEIFTYLVNGELEHRDSMGNVEIIRRGDIQMTSAGTGIRHSEVGYQDKAVHMIQIWALPNRMGLTPRYFTRSFKDEDKVDKLLRVVGPVGSKDVVHERLGTGPAPINSPLEMFATLLSPCKSVAHPLPLRPRRCYVHLIQSSGYHKGPAIGGSVRINGDVVLREGDGAFVWSDDGTGELALENIGEIRAELLVFDFE